MRQILTILPRGSRAQYGIARRSNGDPLLAIPFDLAFLSKRSAGSSDPFGVYSDNGVSVPSVVDGVVAAWRDDLRTLEIGAQTTDANRPILRMVDGIPMLQFVGATPTGLVTNEFNTAGKHTLIVIKRSGGDQRLLGSSNNGILNLASGATQLLKTGASVQSPNYTLFELESISITRTASGNVFRHNGNVMEPNAVDTLGTAELPLSGIGGSFAPYTGYIGAWTVCPEEFGPEADFRVREIFGINAKTNIQTVCLGDSLTSGFGAGTSYPTQLAADRPTFDIVNFGIGGDTVANMLATSTNRVNRGQYGPNRARNIVVVWAGTNDMAIDGRTGAAVYADLVSLCNMLSAYGYEVIVCNTIVRNAGAPFETQRLAYNTLIDTNWNTFASARVNLAGIPELSDFTNLTYFLVDGIHITTAGCTKVKDAVDVQIAAIL